MPGPPWGVVTGFIASLPRASPSLGRLSLAQRSPITQRACLQPQQGFCLLTRQT